MRAKRLTFQFEWLDLLDVDIYLEISSQKIHIRGPRRTRLPLLDRIFLAAFKHAVVWTARTIEAWTFYWATRLLPWSRWTRMLDPSFDTLKLSWSNNFNPAVTFFLAACAFTSEDRDIFFFHSFDHQARNIFQCLPIFLNNFLWRGTFYAFKAQCRASI